MQTAEELATHIENQLFGLGGEERGEAIAFMGKLIEARDNAVRLALLERLLSHAMPAYGIPVVSADVIRSYRDRYSSPVAEPSPEEKP